MYTPIDEETRVVINSITRDNKGCAHCIFGHNKAEAVTITLTGQALDDLINQKIIISWGKGEPALLTPRLIALS